MAVSDYTHTLRQSEVAGGHGKGVVHALRRGLGAFWNSPDTAAVAAVRTLVRWQRRSRDRARLGGMEAYLLADMGITRDQADAEAAKPFWRA